MLCYLLKAKHIYVLLLNVIYLGSHKHSIYLLLARPPCQILENHCGPESKSCPTPGVDRRFLSPPMISPRKLNLVSLHIDRLDWTIDSSAVRLKLLIIKNFFQHSSSLCSSPSCPVFFKSFPVVFLFFVSDLLSLWLHSTAQLAVLHNCDLPCQIVFFCQGNIFLLLSSPPCPQSFPPTPQSVLTLSASGSWWKMVSKCSTVNKVLPFSLLCLSLTMSVLCGWLESSHQHCAGIFGIYGNL